MIFFWPFTDKNSLVMSRKFLSNNEIVEIVNNLSDLKVDSKELVCGNHYVVSSGSLILFLWRKVGILTLLKKLQNVENSIFSHYCWWKTTTIVS